MTHREMKCCIDRIPSLKSQEGQDQRPAKRAGWCFGVCCGVIKHFITRYNWVNALNFRFKKFSAVQSAKTNQWSQSWPAEFVVVIVIVVFVFDIIVVGVIVGKRVAGEALEWQAKTKTKPRPQSFCAELYLCVWIFICVVTREENSRDDQ